MTAELRSIVEVHRDLALRSSVYELVPVDVDVLSALLDLHEAVLNEDHEALFAALDRLEEVRRD